MIMVLVRDLAFKMRKGVGLGRVYLLGLASLLALTTATMVQAKDEGTTVTFPTGEIEWMSLAVRIDEPEMSDGLWNSLMMEGDTASKFMKGDTGVRFGKQRMKIISYGSDENPLYSILAYREGRIYALQSALYFMFMDILSAEPVSGSWYKKDGAMFCDKSAAPCQVKIQWELIPDDDYY